MYTSNNTNSDNNMVKLFKKLRGMETMWQNHKVQLSSLLSPSTQKSVHYI